MRNDPYTAEFRAKVKLKRELADLVRRRDEVEAEVSWLLRAKEQVIAAAQVEAAMIVQGACQAPREGPISVAAIVGEVAIEHRIPPRCLRERGGTPAVRKARQDALRRAMDARPDLNDAVLARFFGGIDPRTVNSVRKQLANG